jgi:hypothetical protein
MLTFAAKLLEHTANQLWQWAREPDFGVKSFADSILLTSQSICMPYQGIILGSTSNPREGFVFRAESCSRNCIKGTRCSHCASKIKSVVSKVRQSVESIVECSGKRATISNILRNLALVAMEICTIQDENRHLHCWLARVVLFNAIAKDGAIFPKGAEGDQIRKVIEIIDGLINKLLQLSVATVELELWKVHAEHISKICGNGKKCQGCQSYHPMHMNWAVAFLSCTSASTYNKVAKIMMLPNISTVY